jgi:hypothetical protein
VTANDVHRLLVVTQDLGPDRVALLPAGYRDNWLSTVPWAIAPDLPQALAILERMAAPSDLEWFGSILRLELEWSNADGRFESSSYPYGYRHGWAGPDPRTPAAVAERAAIRAEWAERDRRADLMRAERIRPTALATRADLYYRVHCWAVVFYTVHWGLPGWERLTWKTLRLWARMVADARVMNHHDDVVAWYEFTRGADRMDFGHLGVALMDLQTARPFAVWGGPE